MNKSKNYFIIILFSVFVLSCSSKINATILQSIELLSNQNTVELSDFIKSNYNFDARYPKDVYIDKSNKHIQLYSDGNIYYLLIDSKYLSINELNNILRSKYSLIQTTKENGNNFEFVYKMSENTNICISEQNRLNRNGLLVEFDKK